MTLEEAINNYEELINIVRGVEFFRPVNWKKEEHLEALKILQNLVENSTGGG